MPASKNADGTVTVSGRYPKGATPLADQMSEAVQAAGDTVMLVSATPSDIGADGSFNHQSVWKPLNTRQGFDQGVS